MIARVSTLNPPGAYWVLYHWHLRGKHRTLPYLTHFLHTLTDHLSKQALGTLLTDLNQDRSSTAAASANLVRCALAATALGVLQPIIDSIGPGWCFTIFGVLSAACALLLKLLILCDRPVR